METRVLADLIRFSDEKMLKNSLFDSEHCFCDLYCLKPGQDQRIHAHSGSDKIYTVLQGRGSFHVGGEERELGSGEAVLAPSGAPHGVRNAGPDDVVLLVFMAPRPA